MATTGSPSSNNDANSTNTRAPGLLHRNHIGHVITLAQTAATEPIQA
jgi:hypothetical protein